MHDPEHADVLPDHIPPITMPDTRLEALWLLVCLDPRRRMEPAPAASTGDRYSLPVHTSDGVADATPPAGQFHARACNEPARRRHSATRFRLR